MTRSESYFSEIETTSLLALMTVLAPKSLRPAPNYLQNTIVRKCAVFYRERKNLALTGFLSSLRPASSYLRNMILEDSVLCATMKKEHYTILEY